MDAQLLKTDVSACVIRLPKEVLALMVTNPGTVFVAGGYIRSILSGEPVKDIDIFVSLAEQAKAIALRLAGNDMTRIHQSQNSYTIKGGSVLLQVITRWSGGSPEDCLKSFDFTNVKAAIWHNGKDWESLCHDDFYEHLGARRVVYEKPNQNLNPGGSLMRMIGLAKRGYEIDKVSLCAVIHEVICTLDAHKFMNADRPSSITMLLSTMNNEQS